MTRGLDLTRGKDLGNVPIEQARAGSWLTGSRPRWRHPISSPRNIETAVVAEVFLPDPFVSHPIHACRRSGLNNPSGAIDGGPILAYQWVGLGLPLL